MIHPEPHTLADSNVTIDLKHIHPQLGDMMIHEAKVFDWWDRIGEASWINSQNLPMSRTYAMRSAFGLGLPVDDEVLLVEVGEILLLIHETEIME